MATRKEVIDGLTSLEKETIRSLIDVCLSIVKSYLRRQNYMMDFMLRRNIRVLKLINDIDANRQSSNVESRYESFRTTSSTFLGDNIETDKLINYINLFLYPEIKKYYYYNREYRELDKNTGNIDIYISDFTTIQKFLKDFKTDLS